MPDQKRIELRRAVVELKERGLYEPARWAAELMAGAPRHFFGTCLKAHTIHRNMIPGNQEFTMRIISCLSRRLLAQEPMIIVIEPNFDTFMQVCNSCKETGLWARQTPDRLKIAVIYARIATGES
jgi:hypothetical protein